MNAAIVDTDVVSMLFKGETRALAYRPHVTGQLLGISFMILAGLEHWSLERGWGQWRKLDLARHLTHYAVLAVSRELRANGPRFLSLPREKASDPNSRRLDCGLRPLLLSRPITNNRSGYSIVDGLVLLWA
jgi:hypothetical protein